MQSFSFSFPIWWKNKNFYNNIIYFSLFVIRLDGAWIFFSIFGHFILCMLGLFMSILCSFGLHFYSILIPFANSHNSHFLWSTEVPYLCYFSLFFQQYIQICIQVLASLHFFLHLLFLSWGEEKASEILDFQSFSAEKKAR